MSSRPNTSDSYTEDPFATPSRRSSFNNDHNPPTAQDIQETLAECTVRTRNHHRSYLSPPTPPTGLTPRASSSALPRRLASSGPLARMKSHLLPSLFERPLLSSITTSSGATNPYTDPKSTFIEKPWLDHPSPRIKISYWLVWGMIGVGSILGSLQCFLTWRDVSHNRMDRKPLCLVYDEDFSSDPFTPTPATTGGVARGFHREVDLSGFGNGQFDMTSSSPNNSYVQNGILHLTPTLTADEIGWDNVFGGSNGFYIYNATDCTFNSTSSNNGYITTPSGQHVFDYNSYYTSCSNTANSTLGTIIRPVKSARVTTKGIASIRYGRVEVRAKMPRGDWLWPAIWLLPTDPDGTYGPWPRSGEIDMVEGRGNGIGYTNRGRNYVQGSLNWGPTPQLNGVGKSYSWWSDKRKGFDEDFHTYVLEWTEKWIRVYVDTRLHTLLEFPFKKPFFQLGDFPSTFINSTTNQFGPLLDPWSSSTNPNAAPFDQQFYLIMNVAVGGTNGWFPEVQGDKPWLNAAGQEKAMRDFALARDRWLPTWTDKAMEVDSVKMWKHCGDP